MRKIANGLFWVLIATLLLPFCVFAELPAHKVSQVQIDTDGDGDFAGLTEIDLSQRINISNYDTAPTSSLAQYTGNGMAWVCRGLADLGLDPAHIITVGVSGCDYTSIKSAVKAASSGDVILIFPGTYSEEVDIAKSNISLIGIDKTKCIIQAAPAGSGRNLVHVYSADGPISGITIANLTIYNSQTWGGGGSIAQQAIDFGTADFKGNAVTDCRVYNCILKGYQDTVFCYPNSEVIWENCYIWGGFDIASSWNATVTYRDCHFHTMHNAGAGAGYQDGGTVTVEGCLFTSTITGASSSAWDLHSASLTCYFLNNAYGPGITHGIMFDKPGGKVYAGGNYGNVIEPSNGVAWVRTGGMSFQGPVTANSLRTNGTERISSTGAIKGTTINATSGFQKGGIDGISTTVKFTDKDSLKHEVVVSGGIITQWNITEP